MNSVLGILYVERKTSGHGFQCDVLLQVIGKKHLVDVRIPGGGNSVSGPVILVE